MLKDLLKKYGIEHAEEISDEDAEKLIDEHITNLSSEKDALSRDKEELTTSVEGYKSSEENLSKELTETKTKLANTEGKLEQVTSMYKEQFERDPEEHQEKSSKDKEALKNDVLMQILGTN